MVHIQHMFYFFWPIKSTLYLVFYSALEALEAHTYVSDVILSLFRQGVRELYLFFHNLSKNNWSVEVTKIAKIDPIL